jgi:NAD-dependent dihydropyrimidine dehydrogenase PreA subunit
MKRSIIKIDEEKCNGCGNCVPNCHEGALQIIDGKARLISDLMCDGLGACIGHCPEGAITIEERESEPYNEIKVMEGMVSKGLNTVVAHLKHLKDHHEELFLKQGVYFLTKNPHLLDFTIEDVKRALHKPADEENGQGCNGGCPGSKTIAFNPADLKVDTGKATEPQPSQLRQWPVQLHLINPAASYFIGSDLLVAADCTAFSLGDFHQKWLKGKSLVIACPKLDQNKEIYLQKFITLIESSIVKSITVLIMEVPCCGGLMRLVEMALEKAGRKVPVKLVTVGVKGEILQEEWIG